MAYGISLSEQQQEEEEQTHPIYTALRAAIEQGTTAPSKSIEVNICTDPFGIPTVMELASLLFICGLSSSSSSPGIFYSHTVNEYGPGFLSIMGLEFTYGQRISS